MVRAQYGLAGVNCWWERGDTCEAPQDVMEGDGGERSIFGETQIQRTPMKKWSCVTSDVPSYLSVCLTYCRRLVDLTITSVLMHPHGGCDRMI